MFWAMSHVMRRSHILQRTCVKILLRTNSSFLWLQSIKYFLCALYHWERMLRCKSKLCLLLCCGFLPLLSPLFCSVPRVSCSAALTAACSALLCCGFAERRVKYSITATLLWFPVLKYNISILVCHLREFLVTVLLFFSTPQIGQTAALDPTIVARTLARRVFLLL